MEVDAPEGSQLPAAPGSEQNARFTQVLRLVAQAGFAADVAAGAAATKETLWDAVLWSHLVGLRSKRKGFTPLLCVVGRASNVDRVAWLVDTCGAPVDAPRTEGNWTPLLWALGQGA